MYTAGVSCTDCHDPHDLKVKGGPERVCMSCHLAEKFDTPKHHFHKADSKGSRCVACHMPTRNYMVVHARRDHSIRIPRPDLSAALGTPNACNQCHRDKSVSWAADAARKWWGDKLRRTPDYGEIAFAGREQRAGAQASLAGYVTDASRPAIRRGTAASMLDPRVAASRAALERALADSDPLVRGGALAASQGLDPSERLRIVSPLLRDPIRAVRFEAVRALASVPGEGMSATERSDFDAAMAEYIESLNVDADRAEAHLQLGALYAMRRDNARAEAEYKAALDLTPGIAAAWANLADLYRTEGREDEAQATLRRGLEVAPRDAGLHHALGLALVRRRQMPEAVEELEKAAALSRDNARYGYVYAVALDSVGKTEKAIGVLAAAQANHTGNPEILEALASFSLKLGKRQAAIDYAKKLVAAQPENPSARALLSELTGAGPPASPEK
jgi:Flp pilus assembly protein TadD